MILSKVVFQTDSSTVPTHQKSVLIRTSSQVTDNRHCLPRISSRAVGNLQKKEN